MQDQTDIRLTRSASCTWWNNVASTSVAVSQRRWDGEFPLLTDTHIRESLVPALDHLTDTQLEGEWLVTVITETMRHTTCSYHALRVPTAEVRKRCTTIRKR
jgi:hypothetical protein